MRGQKYVKNAMPSTEKLSKTFFMENNLCSNQIQPRFFNKKSPAGHCAAGLFCLGGFHSDLNQVDTYFFRTTILPAANG